jgi:hypothetical protein
VRAWPALALACCLAPAWAQTPPARNEVRKPMPVKAQKAHRKATPEQIRKFNRLQRKSDTR